MNNESLLVPEARSFEKRFDWLEAAKLYLHSINKNSKKLISSFSKDLQERAGLCFFRSAFQAETPIEFQRRLVTATECYEEAIRFLRNEKGKVAELEKDNSDQRILVLESKIALIKSWLADDFDLRSNFLSNAVLRAEQALNSSLKQKEVVGVVKSCSQFLSCIAEVLATERKGDFFREQVTKSLDFVERGIEISSSSQEQDELSKILYVASWLCLMGQNLSEPEITRRKLSQLEDDYWNKSKSIIDKLGDSFLLGEGLSYSWHFGEEQPPKSVGEYASRILPQVMATKDNLVIAAMHSAIMYGIRWRMVEEENPEEIALLLKQLEENFREVTRRYGLVRPVGIHSIRLVGSYYALMIGYMICASFELGLIRKVELLETALETGKAGLSKMGEYARNGYLEIGLAQILNSKADLEPSPGAKRGLLDQALNYAKSGLALQNEVARYSHWDIGATQTFLSSLEFERSKLEQRSERREELIKDAIEFSSRGIESLHRAIKEKEAVGIGFEIRVAYYYGQQGKLWGAMYKLMRDDELLTKKLNALQQATKIYEAANKITRVAESFWETGITYSLLADHLRASRSYEQASAYFSRASEKIPNLKNYYNDYVSYMLAWVEIERARESHQDGDLESSEKRYSGASDLLEKLQTWSHLKTHYHGCALMESAESKSRNEDFVNAIDCFEKTAKVFDNSHSELSKKAMETDNAEARETVLDFADASLLRKKYCEARSLLDRGRLAHKNGDSLSSRRGYALAKEIFQGVIESSRYDNYQKREMEGMISLCMALEKMMEAEATISPESYKNAAELFRRAYESSLTQKSALAAKGNANYCMALSASLQFRETKRLDDYMTAKSHLAEAVDNYSRAGLPSTSQWALATERMLDAYVYINNALKEIEPDKKAKNYLAAERLLELSAGIYEKAGYSSRKREVLEALRKVKQERQVTLSLVEVFAAPSIVSNSTALSVLSPTREEPAGLSEFQTANVQIVPTIPNEIISEEEFQIRLDLINTGNESATIHKIENLIPKGLTVSQNESISFEENGMLDFKGKRLQPMQIYSINFLCKAVEIGHIDFHPKVIFSDKSGKLVMKTLHSPLRILVKPSWKFKNENASSVFNHLADAFVKDYMVQRLDPERSGWRSLVDVGRETGIPLSSIYGKRGGIGLALEELIKRGLIQSRIFTGERGRGGEITRVRVAYDKEPIRDFVTQKIRSQHAR